ncbi:MAG: glycine betaine ABC transporter substrate-binding protein [Myxococcaceae bacterium]
MTALLLLGSILAADARVIHVGSKKFTESVILGDVAADVLRANHLNADHRRELGGSRVLWDAVVRGELDAYPEYTGTIRSELLPGSTDLRAALASKGLEMTGPLGFENSYAIGMKADHAQALSLQTISELAKHPELKLGLSNEFMDRADGWPALIRTYSFSPGAARGLDHDLAYRALDSGEIDATDLYSTDAEIQQYGLVTLKDDRHAFPEYAAVIVYRSDLPADAKAALAKLQGAITTPEMIQLNASAKLKRIPEEVIAADFVQQKFGVISEVKLESFSERLWRRTREHLALVGVSLFAAIAVAIPLGVVAARRRRLGSVLTSGAGVVQTIPSLALLVFMIPLLGIGAVPAMAALFLYSVLPILRGTHSGLCSLPQEIRDSADALGLSDWAKLRLIELPLATRSILSGIKTAAVINVGTATLGALIGAGGYGQPILTGIRLADTRLILEGAVPAAVLALLVQAMFDGIERVIVPRGLR